MLSSYCCTLIFAVGHLFLLLQAKNCCCHRQVIVACKWPFWATVPSTSNYLPTPMIRIDESSEYRYRTRDLKFARKLHVPQPELIVVTVSGVSVFVSFCFCFLFFLGCFSFCFFVFLLFFERESPSKYCMASHGNMQHLTDTGPPHFDVLPDWAQFPD